MKTQSHELGVLQKTLSEIKELSGESSLQEVVDNLSVRSQKVCGALKLKALPLSFSNYAKTSHTLLLKELPLGQQVARLEKALVELRSKCLSPWELDHLLQLNAQVLGRTEKVIRHSETDPDYAFPHPSLIEEGMALLLSACQVSAADSLSEFVLKVVAFSQGLLSVHPFEDGNHRTTRLVMDFLLTERGLPPVLVDSGFDLLMANPSRMQVFKLEAAVQKVLYGMNDSLIHLENTLN